MFKLNKTPGIWYVRVPCKNDGWSVPFTKSAMIDLILWANCVPSLSPVPGRIRLPHPPQGTGPYAKHFPYESIWPSILSGFRQKRWLTLFAQKPENSGAWSNVTITATKCLFSPWHFSLPSRSKFISVTTATDNCCMLPAKSCFALSSDQ